MTQYEPDSNWINDFATRLGEDPDSVAVKSFLAKSHAGYLERTSAEDAAFDENQLSLIRATIQADRSSHEEQATKHSGIWVSDDSNPHRLVFAPPLSRQPGTIRLKRYGAKGAELSVLVHVLDSFGFAVVEHTPSVFSAGGEISSDIHLDDIELRWTSQNENSLAFDLAIDGQRFALAIAAIDEGRTEIDLLNRLVISAQLNWRDVALLRAYRCYRLQLSTSYSVEDLDQALFSFPLVTRALLGYFESKFNPEPSSPSAEMAKARSLVADQLQSVTSFAHDQILRGYLELIDETVRTSYFLRGPEGIPFATIVLKFAPEARRGSILPHSMLETFVFAREVLGIHLRAGKVARGGIRWSERIEDFRTEIYELAMAQIKKNAIIVPTGAKGGFVVRNTTTPSPAQIETAYKTFICSLLDITDNVVDGRVVTPQGVVTYDEDDHYLVVAADKGTATFSDLANAISLERGFWLGDAFASGGSHGYDHKALAITARGAWSAVRRHFKKLDLDVDRDPFRAVGVGDMSGDIFGNGMLQSRQIKLVAAFDHRHVFIDPDPDLDTSFGERRRLATLARSSWADYDPKLISKGGGVWSRNSKKIPLDSEARHALGISTDAVTPPQVISAILSAPVDMIWFGGIGTYVKDKDESDEEVGDSGNDSIRITADKVRARVIAEGANLAVTQRARIRYSRRGGRINTDFIDNAGGVAMSDYEVNLKILLELAIASGVLDRSSRDAVLQAVSDEAVSKVLRQVEDGVVALDRVFDSSAEYLDAFEALIESWEETGTFDRELDFLPGSEEFARRRSAQAGLTRPELAVLQSYSKSHLAASLETEPSIMDPTLSELAQGYFPASVMNSFGVALPGHPLYRELVATILAGETVNRMGIVWAHEIAEELDYSLSEVTEAFWLACKVTGALELWDRIDEMERGSSGEDAINLHRSLTAAMDKLARMYLTETRPPVLAEVIARDREVLSALRVSAGASGHEIASLLQGPAQKLTQSELTERLSLIQRVPRVLEAQRIARSSGAEPGEVISLFDGLDQISRLDEIDRILDTVSIDDRWTSWQINGIRADLDQWRKEQCLSLLASSTSAGLKESLAVWAVSNQGTFKKVGALIEAAKKKKGGELVLIPLAVRTMLTVK